jgi:LDH2 family malate/lactate/ureidoglycolate dehydrogenase
MTTMCDEITSAPLAPGVDRIVIPGELAAEREAHALAHGKVFSAHDWAPIKALGEAAGFSPP